MRNSIRRLVAAMGVGVVASLLLVSPAQAVSVWSEKSFFHDEGAHIELWNDARRIKIAHVTVNYWDPGRYLVQICDSNREGLSSTFRVDAGGGVGVNYLTVRGACKEDVIPVRKFRLIWGNYATGWYPPRAS